jgi:hypothetical protein
MHSSTILGSLGLLFIRLSAAAPTPTDENGMLSLEELSASTARAPFLSYVYTIMIFSSGNTPLTSINIGTGDLAGTIRQDLPEQRAYSLQLE